MFTVETRFPTNEVPEGDIRRTEGLALDKAMLKVRAILDHLDGVGWEIDEMPTVGATAWIVAKLGANGYTVGSVVLSE